MAITCKTCDSGEMVKRKKYRLSGPAVVIGYLFLIPCVLGMGLGFVMFAATGTAVSSDAFGDRVVRQHFEEAALPESAIQQVVAHGDVDQTTMTALTGTQRDAIEAAKSLRSSADGGKALAGAVGGGISIFLIVSSFVGGLFGWILTMKKRVLQCTECAAVVQAS